MKKFWRSGMIDKKVIAERERKEYINRLHRTILELSKKPPEPEPRYATFYTSDNRSFKRKITREKPLTPTQSAKKWGEGIAALFTGEYDEVKRGDDITLEFRKWLIKNANKRCDADIEFGRKIEEIINNANNTRTLRQEE